MGHVSAQHLVEQFLVQVARNHAGDFLNLEAEVTLVAGHFFLLDFQQGGQFRLVVVKRNRRIEHQHGVGLGTVEDGFLLVVLHIGRHHDGTFHLHTLFFRIAVLIEFGQQTLQHILVLVVFHLLILAVALSVHIDLLLYHFVGHVDVIVVHCIVVGEFHIELGSQGNVEAELKVLVGCEVGVVLFRQRCAQHVHLVVLDVGIHLFLHQLVNLLNHDRSPELLLD